MRTHARILLAVALFITAISAFAVQDQRAAAREELNQGVKAYKTANYDEAIRHFENAVSIDPELKVGRLYLATAYAQQYVPGVETPENVAMAAKAIDQYKQALDIDPVNMTAVKGIAYLKMQLKHFDEARAEYKRAIEIDPNNPETYYSVGVIDWSMAYSEIMAEKIKLGMKTDDVMIRSPRCTDLRDVQMGNIEDALRCLRAQWSYGKTMMMPWPIPTCYLGCGPISSAMMQ
ncbi:MAG TPA: tetratricopeptide repeat protein [Candidatus Angelobacter sp.]|nr:tetratricopeptide repeat protein [Candidatus Angelobacter sp.]